ncbi:MAG: hypothetical protein KKG59_05740 [Nanoarchaeota archaeon]|nr:hypothetical protein [Nanoarchaeota archaeon]
MAIKRIKPDIKHSESLLKMSMKNIQALDSIELTADNTELQFSDYYKCLRQVVDAIAIRNGYKLRTHEVGTEYLKRIGKGQISRKYDRFRKIRNRINYYGAEMSLEHAKATIKEINECIAELRGLVGKGI